ncbi:hypothetical protein E2542_SST19616 [Spatholobus suberectus]|nr:hypothetical protein E2542_SST19616 [Spatholobus suberectus]
MESARVMMQTDPPLDSAPSSPSFSSHCSETLSQIAARVIHEVRSDPDHTLSDSSQQNDNDVDVGDDFEFSFVPRHPDSSPVSADDIFCNGQIRPIYPLFHLNSVADADASSIPAETARRRRLPLRKLMFEERETVDPTVVNDSDELDGVAAGTYCVWTPPCKKTSSSSKRWKLRDLLVRSHSDGKRTSKVAPKHSSADNGGAAAKLVGFFSNANGLGRNLPPFSR